MQLPPKLGLLIGLVSLGSVACRSSDVVSAGGANRDRGGGGGATTLRDGKPAGGGTGGAVVAVDGSGGREGAVAGSGATSSGGDRGARSGGDGGGGAKGGAGGSPGAGSGGADPFVGDVAPTHAGDVWRLAFGPVLFEASAAKGASVTTFSRGGHNVLADGSHFRPSPQKAWTWPPPPEIAMSPYTASVSGNAILMESQTSAQYGLKAKKRFWANAASEVVTIEYTLTNTSSARASWAPWEVSRVNATGLTFFPEGAAIAPKPASFGQTIALQSAGGVAWLDYKAAPYISGNYIVARDGLEGWSAHAEAGIVFIKSFPDVPAAQIPPEEGELQLWTDSTHVVLEMENEGAYVPLGAGQSIVWTMRWYLRALPPDVPVAVGSDKLLAFVRSQLVR